MYKTVKMYKHVLNVEKRINMYNKIYQNVFKNLGKLYKNIKNRIKMYKDV